VLQLSGAIVPRCTFPLTKPVAMRLEFVSVIRVAGDAFRERTRIVATDRAAMARLMANGTLCEQRIVIRDLRPLIGLLTVRRNGFECRQLPDGIVAMLRRIACTPDEGIEGSVLRRQLRDSIGALLTGWRAIATGETGVVGCSVDAVVRRLGGSRSQFDPIPLAHADFPLSRNYKTTVAAFSDRWQQSLPRAPHDVVEILNVWMPLDPCIRYSHLGLLDVRTTAPSIAALRAYTAQRRTGQTFEATILANN
jgi:hypothetical protein